MKVEINMINVEDGDAIFIGLENADNLKALIVIDGGYKRFYNSRVKPRLEQILSKYDNKITLLVCTHYDNDHLEGAGKILDDYHSIIQEIWIHKIDKPLTEQIEIMKASLNLLEEELDQKKKFKYLAGISELEDTFVLESYRELIGFIEKLGKYNFEGRIAQATRGKKLRGFENFEVISPTAEYYNEYLSKLKDEKYLEDIKYNLSENRLSLQEKYLVNEVRGFIDGVNPCESLEKSSVSNRVTPTNMVSIVTLLTINDKKFLFTGDAGIESFESQGILDEKVKDLFWLDVPHHGSKNNTSKRMLEHFNPEKVFVSGEGIDNRPHKNITNCLKKRRAGENQFTTNSPTNTWYLKINEMGKVERVFLQY